MIAGYFAADGSPYVEMRVNLPRLGVAGQVHFLVDTGSDTSILHPSASVDLRCPFDAVGEVWRYDKVYAQRVESRPQV